MATLVSPGVSVSVINESFFIPVSAPTVPLIFIATREGKTQTDTVTPAAGTLESSVVRTITSLSQSLSTYGVPYFRNDNSDMMTKGLTVVATHDHHDRGGWTERKIDALFFKLVRDGAFALDGLITHEFPPAQFAEAYALASERRESAVGVLFDWTQLQ